MNDKSKEVVDVIKGQEPTPIIYGEQEEFERLIARVVEKELEECVRPIKYVGVAVIAATATYWGIRIFYLL